MIFHGVMTALVTPFQTDGSVDLAGFRALVRRQLSGGVQGLVPCGTTGEAPTLSRDEQRQLIGACVEEAAKQAPVLAGIGSNNTAAAIENAKQAQELGAHGVLATAPYYNKPTQEGLYRHFMAIADAIDIEVCLYDVPGRTNLKMAPETILRLADHPNITTLKDATGDLAHASRVLRACEGRLTVLSGDDFTTLPHLTVGGSGCISVASNVVPDLMATMVGAARSGDLSKAREIHNGLFPLFDALFVQTNPLPVKAALARLGLCHDVFRLPLCPMDEAARPTLHEAMDALKLS
ncbi:MAG: 4-hydroxy-tetrahydrodipicolinate synthase [Myxococcota bacterium]